MEALYSLYETYGHYQTVQRLIFEFINDKYSSDRILSFITEFNTMLDDSSYIPNMYVINKFIQKLDYYSDLFDIEYDGDAYDVIKQAYSIFGYRELLEQLQYHYSQNNSRSELIINFIIDIMKTDPSFVPSNSSYLKNIIRTLSEWIEDGKCSPDPYDDDDD
jgi:hypothetical protein